jgi:phosphinothricin tripeptide acetyl hydrolase
MNREEKVDYILSRLRAAWQPPDDTPGGERAAFEATARLFPEPVGVDESRETLDGVDVLITTPLSVDPERTIVYLHGGAFIIGSARIYRDQSARIAFASGAAVVSVDYRRAPEHPFPAAVEDAATVFRALSAHDGMPPERVVMAGDSAGANLTLAASLVLCREGAALPAGLVLLSPWADLACRGETMETNANPRHLAQRAGLLWSASRYLNGHDPNDELASPLFADLTGLPPMLIQVGALETLLDDARALERTASAVGVPVTLEVWDGMFHEWHLLSALLPEGETLHEAERAIESIAAFVRTVTG